MTKKRIQPKHTCGQAMVWRGKRGDGAIQRWWCPKCDAWTVARGAARGLRSAKGYGLDRVADLASHGMSTHAISQQVGMGWEAVERRIERMAANAEERFLDMPPKPGKAWALVDLPYASQMQGKAAIGRIRSTLRLLDWETGHAAAAALVGRLGSHPDSIPWPEAKPWLDGALGTAVRDWTEAERRLWVILARSNGWRLGEEP